MSCTFPVTAQKKAKIQLFLIRAVNAHRPERWNFNEVFPAQAPEGYGCVTFSSKNHFEISPTIQRSFTDLFVIRMEEMVRK